MKRYKPILRIALLTAVFTVLTDTAVRLLIFFLPEIAGLFSKEAQQILAAFKTAEVTFGFVAAVPLSVLLSVFVFSGKGKPLLRWLLGALFILLLFTVSFLASTIYGIPVFSIGKAVLILL